VPPRERYTESPFSTAGKHFFMKPWPRSFRAKGTQEPPVKGTTKEARKVTEHRKRP
jgi:hypothetical protein